MRNRVMGRTEKGVVEGSSNRLYELAPLGRSRAPPTCFGPTPRPNTLGPLRSNTGPTTCKHRPPRFFFRPPRSHKGRGGQRKTKAQ